MAVWTAQTTAARCPPDFGAQEVGQKQLEMVLFDEAISSIVLHWTRNLHPYFRSMRVCFCVSLSGKKWPPGIGIQMLGKSPYIESLNVVSPNQSLVENR
jgi:hypothetical protein